MGEDVKILVLDDDTEHRWPFFLARYPGADLVATAIECIDRLRKSSYDVIFLDHDLGGEVYVSMDRKDTGSEVARFLTGDGHVQKKDAMIICHSLNYNGRMNMVSLLMGAGFTDVQNIPFSMLK